MNWNLTDAKNRLGELLDRAKRDGPQRIRRGNEAYVVLRESEYDRLARQRPSFKDWLFNGPAFDDLEFERGTDHP
jgi:antitoxin Phd